MTSSWLARIALTLAFIALWLSQRYALGVLEISIIILIASGLLKLYEIHRKKKKSQES